MLAAHAQSSSCLQRWIKSWIALESIHCCYNRLKMTGCADDIFTTCDLQHYHGTTFKQIFFFFMIGWAKTFLVTWFPMWYFSKWRTLMKDGFWKCNPVYDSSEYYNSSLYTIVSYEEIKCSFIHSLCVYTNNGQFPSVSGRSKVQSK